MRLDSIDTIVGSLVTIVARACLIIQIERQSSVWTVIPFAFVSTPTMKLGMTFCGILILQLLTR